MRPSSRIFKAIVAAVAGLFGPLSAADATILTFEGFTTNTQIPPSFASNLAGPGTGYTQGNGFTPNIAVTFTPTADGTPGNGWQFYQDDEWAGVAQIDGDPPNYFFDIAFTPQSGFGVKVNSFELDDYAFWGVGTVYDWRLIGVGNTVLFSGDDVSVPEDLSPNDGGADNTVINTGMTSFYGGPLTLRVIPKDDQFPGQSNSDRAMDNLNFDQGVAAPVPNISTWNVDAAGDWHLAGNWDAGVPNGVDHEARFNSAINAAHTVFADAPVTVGTVRFDNANSYVLAGASTLTLEVSSGSALVEVAAAGTHKINLPLVIASDTTFSVAVGATLKISDPMTINAGKVVTQSPGGPVLYESTVAVLGGAELAMANSNHMAGLSIASTGKATLSAAGDRTLRVDTLSITGTGKLDLTDNKMIATAQPVGSWNGTAYTGIIGLIQSGRGNGTWNGGGIVTSMTDATTALLTSLAVASAADAKNISGAQTALFGGQAVTPADALVMYTYAGDANLSGIIDGDDFFRIDSGFTGGLKGWFNGDFDYNGVIDADDYWLIDRNYSAQSAPFSSGAVASGGSLASVSAVPEPASLSLLVLAASALLGRRRRPSLTSRSDFIAPRASA